MVIRFFIFFIPLLFSIGLLSQEKQRYFEDQFYIGLSYNSLGGKVDQLKENKFSFSVNYGFIKDIPISENGKLAIGLGIGLAHNSLNNNLKLNESELNFVTNLSSINTNRYNYTEFQIPFEFRWRNSSLTNYKFWRIYPGLRFSRVIKSKYIFEDDTNTNNIDVFPMEKNQLGVTLNVGFNTWNISLYQSLNSFYNKNDYSDIEDLKQFRMGFVFYIF